MYGYGRGFGIGPGPGSFGFSLTSRSLRDNPEIPGEWEREHYNRKKGARVARKIEEVARKAGVGGRWFHYFNPDLMDSLSKAFPRAKHPEVEGSAEVNKADLKAGVAQIKKYLVAERDRFDASKHGVYEDDHWKGQHSTAKEMLEEWKRVEGALAREGRSRSRGRSAGRSRSVGRSPRGRSASRSRSAGRSSGTRRRATRGGASSKKTTRRR